MPHSGCDRGLVRQLRSLLRHSGRCGDTAGTYDAVQDVLDIAPATVLPTPQTSFKLSTPQSPRTAWARPSEAAPTLTRTRPWPAEPSECRHATPGGWYTLQQPPRRQLELPGRQRDLRKTRTTPRTTATPGAMINSSRPTHAPNSGKTMTSNPLHTCTSPPPCVYKRRR